MTLNPREHNLLNIPDAELIYDFFSQAPVAMGIYMGKEHTVVMANPKMLEVWGRTTNQVINKPLFEALPEVRGQGYEEILATVYEKGIPFKGSELPAILNRNNKLETAYFNIDYQPILKEGRITGVIQLATEVTDLVKARQRVEAEKQTAARKAMEDEAARQSKALRDFFMEAPAMICILSGPDHVFDLVNPSYQQLFPGKELIGKRIVDAIPELIDQPVKKILDEVYQTGVSFIGNETPVILKRNGGDESKLMFLNFIYQARYNFEKKIVGVYIFAMEVTEQVHARKIIEEAAVKTKTILDGISHIAWTANPEGSNTSINKRWFEFTGTSADVPLKQSWKEHLHPDDLEPSAKVWRRSVETGEEFQVEYRFKNKEGEYRWMLGRALPVINDKGEISQWIGTCTDIHDYKILQKNLQSTTEELAASNEELVNANNQLAMINADLDNFIYTASHDLRAPISNIEGLLNNLQRNLPAEHLQNETITKITSMMQVSIDRFKKTIGDLTDITKIQKDTAEEKTVVPLMEVIEEVQLDLESMIIESQAVFEVDVSYCSAIRFSRKNLRSIIYNLISNAIKYRSASRSLMIKIECRQDNEYNILSVTDNGLGMKSTEQKKIFSMFKRLHTHVEGTGIGLYIVKKIVDNARGKIEVFSELGKGSTFKIYFLK